MKRNDNFIAHEVGGESLLVPVGPQVVDTNGIVKLNATGRLIWELLAQDRSLDELAESVSLRFEVDPARARADVAAFLEESRRMGLIE
jgi:hypothetical protein